MNHLDPAIKKDPWTSTEDAKLLELHQKLGNRWVEFAKELPGRSENSIKNRWNSILKKRLERDSGASGSANSSEPVAKKPRTSSSSAGPVSAADKRKYTPKHTARATYEEMAEKSSLTSNTISQGNHSPMSASLSSSDCSRKPTSSCLLPPSPLAHMDTVADDLESLLPYSPSSYSPNSHWSMEGNSTTDDNKREVDSASYFNTPVVTDMSFLSGQHQLISIDEAFKSDYLPSVLPDLIHPCN